MKAANPRYCPECGAKGKRQYREPKNDPRGPRFAMECPQCGQKWDWLCMLLPRKAVLPEGHASVCE